MVIETPNFEIDLEVEESAYAVTPNAIYSDGMCLQREKVLHIHGTTTQSAIAVELNGKTYYGTVRDGKFDIYLAPQQAGGPYTMTFYGNSAKRTLNDIYIGEVFLCSGQSNMEMTLNQCGEVHLADYEAAGSDLIRMLAIPKTTSKAPVASMESAVWTAASKETILHYSCVAYLFANHMQKALDIPVGVVTAAWGGSVAAFWMPEAAYVQLSTECDIYTVAGNTEFTPCVGYNAMIAPLQDFAFRSVLWYQGESNANHTAKTYDKEMEALIRSWRETMHNPELGFTIIELPRFSADAIAWATIRQKQQLLAKNDPMVCMSISIDLGEWEDIHPRDKSLFARRAAEETLKTFFRREANPYPAVKAVERISDNQIRIVFDNVGDGIRVSEFANGFETSKDGKLYTPVKEYTWDANSITITSNKRIAFVRYGYRSLWTNVDYQGDVSLQVSVWNSYGNPLDQFLCDIP